MTDTQPKKRGRPPNPDKGEKPKRPRGRPPKVKNLDEEIFKEVDALVLTPIKRANPNAVVLDEKETAIIGRLAAIFCTQDEICSILNISATTLKEIFKRQPEVREIYESGYRRAKISLRRKQFELAGKSHPMSIFLGKNFLGQKDVQDINTTIHKPAAEMTMEQLMEIAGQAIPDNAPKPKVH